MCSIPIEGLVWDSVQRLVPTEPTCSPYRDSTSTADTPGHVNILMRSIVCALEPCEMVVQWGWEVVLVLLGLR